MHMQTLNQRTDVRDMLLDLGWIETAPGTMRRGGVVAFTRAADVVITGPARVPRRADATASFPASVPAPVIVAACEAWTF